MSMSRDEIRTAALELAPDERETLAEELLLSVTGADREAIEAAWLAEARRRDAAFERGETSAKPVQDVIDRLAKRARS